MANREVQRPRTREEEIIASRPPLRTLLWLTIGPLCSQISSSCSGLANTLWVSSKAANPDQVQSVFGLVMTIDFIPTAFGFFLSVCASIKLSALFAENRYNRASHVFADLLRLAVVIGVVLPLILIPAARPIMRWLEPDSEQNIREGFVYLVILFSGTVVTCVYLLLCGCLEAEGRTVWFSCIQIISMALNQGIFNPILIACLDMGVAGAAVSMIGSQFIGALSLLFLYYRGTFTVKPRAAELFEAPVGETSNALALGVSSLFGSLATCLPVIAFQKFLSLRAPNADERNDWIALYNDFTRLYAIVIAIFLAICMGFMAAGAYAYASSNIARVMRLFLHAWWMCCAVGACFSVLMDVDRDFVPSWFGLRNQPHMMEKWRTVVRRYCSSTVAFSWMFIGTTLLQVTNRPARGFICAMITQVSIFPICSAIWYSATKKPDMLFWASLTSDLTDATITVLFVIVVFREFARRVKEEKGQLLVEGLKSIESKDADAMYTVG
jgi:Na+-driven multidrug efflux pump